MDFTSEYNFYSKIKLTCELGPDIQVDKIMHGSGGSHNIIIKATMRNESSGKIKVNKKNKPLIIKIFPLDFYHNAKTKPNYDKLEIKFYQFFTQKYLLTNRTPHIVGIYSYSHCSDIENLIKKKLLKKPCPSFSDQLTNPNLKQSESDNYLCDILLKKEMKLITKNFDMALIEYCPTDIFGFLRQYILWIKSSEFKSTKHINFVNNMVYGIVIIIFQIIFTLGIIKEDYPGFLHGDFFLRNILLQSVKSYNESDYVAYHYKNKIFYLPANGICIKINDFGMTTIANKIEPNIFNPYVDARLAVNGHNFDPFGKKTDLYNFFIDLYRNILDLTFEYELPKNEIKSVLKTINNFFDTNAIDKIYDKELLFEIWHIDDIKVLSDTLKTPVEYLEGNYFNALEKLDIGSNIIKHYNAN